MTSLRHSVDQLAPAKAELRGEILAKQPAWFTEAIAVSVHHTRGLAKRIAAALSVRENAVYEVADRYNPKPLKAWWIPTIVRETGSFAILDALEAECGRFAIELPTPDSHGVLHTHVAQSMKEFGDVLHVSGAALADGRIDDDERERLVTEIDEHLRVMWQFRAAVIAKARQDAAA